MRAIKTKYKGIEFRSGLEARWAKFLDEFDIKWMYEPEGYQMRDGTCYLPDFYLPDQKQFFEVKGIMTDLDMHKIESLVKESRKSVIIGCPDGSIEIADALNMESVDENGVSETSFYEYFDEDVCLASCRSCGKYWFMNTIYSWECRCCGEYDGDHHIAAWLDANDIQSAFQSIQIKVGQWN